MIFRLQHRNEYSRGFTIIEAVTSLTITAVILIGLAVSAVAIMYYYRNDWVVNDLNNYGNLMVQEIAKKMEAAKEVDVTSVNNHKRIELTDFQGRHSYIDWNENEGFFLNNAPLMNGVSLPASGLYRELGHREITLDFDCKKLRDEDIVLPNRGATAFENSVFLIEIKLTMTTSYPRQDDQEQEFVYEKRVFASNTYLSKRHAPVAPPPGARTTL